APQPPPRTKKSLRTSLYNNNHHHYYSIPIKCKNQDDEEDEVNDWAKNCQFLKFRYSRAQLRYFKILIGLVIIAISLIVLAYNEVSHNKFLGQRGGQKM